MPRVLTISTLYPNSAEPGRGVFVRHRLQAAARVADLRLIAAVDFKLRRLVAPDWADDGTVRVCHPAWWHPPGGGALNPWFLAASLDRRVRAVRREFPFELLDAQFGFPDGPAVAALAARYEVPFTITLRGSEQLHATYPMRRACLSWAFRRAAFIFAAGDRLREFALRLGASPERLKTVPNGVDSSVFYPRDRAAVRQEFGIAADQTVIAAAGHLIALKGFDQLIRAVAALDERVHLWIAGSGGGEREHEARLRALPGELGVAHRVHICGRLDQDGLAALMSAADVFCLASSREGWPNVVQEAMSCGTPVVATDVGAVPQMIQDGVNGLVTPPDDVEALAEALRRAAGREWNRSDISTRAQARGWDQVGREVTGQWAIAAGGR